MTQEFWGLLRGRQARPSLIYAEAELAAFREAFSRLPHDPELRRAAAAQLLLLPGVTVSELRLVLPQGTRLPSCLQKNVWGNLMNTAWLPAVWHWSPAILKELLGEAVMRKDLFRVRVVVDYKSYEETSRLQSFVDDMSWTRLQRRQSLRLAPVLALSQQGFSPATPSPHVFGLEVALALSLALVDALDFKTFEPLKRDVLIETMMQGPRSTEPSPS